MAAQGSQWIRKVLKCRIFGRTPLLRRSVVSSPLSVAQGNRSRNSWDRDARAAEEQQATIAVEFSKWPFTKFPSKTFPQRSGEVEAIEVHHLGPRRHEVFHELLLRVLARIDFREGAQLRVRTEDQVDAGAGPLDLARLPVAPLVHAFGASGRLPLRAHVEQVDEEVVRQRPWPLGKDAMFGLPEVSIQGARAADENRHLGGSQR